MFSSFILPMEEKKDNRGEENKREKKKHDNREKTCDCQRVEERCTESLELADANYLYREWINNKVLLYSTESYIQWDVEKLKPNF